MISPFPGMDPYLEAPDIWPDFHDRLATELTTALNGSLPGPYYARLEMRPEVGIVASGGGASKRRIVPDVAVVKPIPAKNAGGVALLDDTRTSLSVSFDVDLKDEMISHPFVEIRDPSRGHLLITLIEIVSPSNKEPGADRIAYQRKQDEILESSANLIEIDLLRGGERLVPIEIDQFLQNHGADYAVTVNRAWKRARSGGYQVFPAVIREPLPVIAVPLREGEAEVPLDLQSVFRRAYAGGPYRRGAVDYARPPRPPLSGEDSDWAVDCLRDAGLN